MLWRMSGAIAKRWIEKGYIADDAYDWYEYGVYSFFSGVLNLLMLMLIGLVIGHFWLTIVFILIFSVNREFMGGVHCETPVGCKFFSILIFLTVIYSSVLFGGLNSYVPYAVLINFVLGNYIIYKLCPAVHHNKPTTAEQRKNMKRLSYISYNITCAIGAAVLFWDITIAKEINIILAVVYISVIIGFFKERRCGYEECREDVC